MSAARVLHSSPWLRYFLGRWFDDNTPWLCHDALSGLFDLKPAGSIRINILSKPTADTFAGIAKHIPGAWGFGGRAIYPVPFDWLKELGLIGKRIHVEIEVRP